ncbi:regulatory protein, luxR family [Thermoactinomyces sp. DSM 45891]|uniref:LuxR C-terminal-related transcriptional regulator n=1 Tax=Thermoactinomyces sp. DSM 45891 TaxID=1761907 RepID=UPI00091A7C95|nr:helix-turn-helix transcriptional regulator [Thermoactinomyces sp. DSM 45891]SFX31659.1 regulatory protein, luxR family [Thermoactinomyces sp. DSM 45891]
MDHLLSCREVEVAVLVAKGYKDNEIALSLFISRRRVGEIIASIKSKWHITSRVQIGIITYYCGLIDIKKEVFVKI